MKLTQEQLAKLIAKVFSNLTAKFAEAGKNVNDITADDILAELSAVLEEMNAGEGEGAPAGDGEGKGEGEGAPAGEGEGEGDAEGKGLDDDELIGKDLWRPCLVCWLLAMRARLVAAPAVATVRAAALLAKARALPVLPLLVLPRLRPSASTPACSCPPAHPVTATAAAASRPASHPCLPPSAARLLTVCLVAL